MKFIIVFWIFLLCVPAVIQAHNSIVPRPQKISYGKSQLLLKGLTIGFAYQPSAEDKFAARELSDLIEKTTGYSANIMDSGLTGTSILFERTGSISPLPIPEEKTGPGTRESYKISVTSNRLRITASSSAGLFYGVQTIRQMIGGTGDKAFLPEAEIEDWPSIAYRGFMMDMSHAQLPRIDEIKKQIDFLSRWKANQYLFYSEASIELEGYPLLMADARYTKDQVKEVIAYARARHMDVIPNMDLYGHLHDLFRLEKYADLSVIPHGGEFKPKDPRVKLLLEDWIAQISSLFPSPFLHIGFDETWLLEIEAKKMNMAPEELYLEMLNQTTDIVEKNGKIALCGADMLQKFPAIVPRVSQKMIAVPWHYFPLTDIEYDKLLIPFSKAGVPIIVQGAIINWNWLVPEYGISFRNTNLLIAACKKYNAIGYITSGWTDDTQTLMRLGFPDMAYGVAASWQNDPIDQESFFKDYTLAQYPPQIAEKVENALLALNASEAFLSEALGATDPAFWDNPFLKDNLKRIEENKENLHKGRLTAEEAQVSLLSALKEGIDTSNLFTLYTGARMLDYLALKYLYAGEIADFWKQINESSNKIETMRKLYMELAFKYHTRTSDLLDGIMATKVLFRKAWLMEYTTYRLEVALGKFDYEYQFWLKFQLRLEQLYQHYNDGDALPSLESLSE
jgi:hexosaminidase